MTDRELIAGCLNKDPDSQRMLYEIYMPYIYGICKRFNVAQEEVKDVIQEIFVEVFSSLHRYIEEKGQLKFWIKSIAIHLILKIFRKKQIVYQEWKEESCCLPIQDPSIQLLEAEYLLQLVAELPEGYRIIFNLYVVDGYSHREIGSMLNIAESSSRSQLSRAKKLLQQKLSLLMKS